MTNTPGEPESSDAVPSGETSELAGLPARSPQETEGTVPPDAPGGEGTSPAPSFNVGQVQEGNAPANSESGVAIVEVVRDVAATNGTESDFDVVDFPDERVEQEKSFDVIETSREETRAILAKSLIFLFAGTIGASFIYIFVSSFIPRPVSCLPANLQMSAPAAETPVATEPSPMPGVASSSAAPDSNVTLCSFDNSAKDLITLILNSLTAIIGTALGFYFGTQTRGDRVNQRTAPGNQKNTE